MCGLDSDFDMLHSKQLAVNNKQKAQMANDKLVETDARIGRKTIRFTLSRESSAPKSSCRAPYKLTR